MGSESYSARLSMSRATREAAQRNTKLADDLTRLLAEAREAFAPKAHAKPAAKPTLSAVKSPKIRFIR